MIIGLIGDVWYNGGMTTKGKRGGVRPGAGRKTAAMLALNKEAKASNKTVEELFGESPD